MKVLLLLLFFPLYLIAQDIQVSWNQTFISSSIDSTAQFEATVQNNGTQDQNIAVIKEIVDAPSDWSCSFCVGIQCYDSPVDTVQFMVSPKRPISVYLDIVTGHTQAVAQYRVQFIKVGDTVAFHQQILKVSTNPLGVDEDKVLISDFKVGKNYPNPFNPSTSIPVSIKTPGIKNVSFEVYDITGKQIYSDKMMVSGPSEFKISWNAVHQSSHPVASGIYIYRIRINQQTYSGKMIFMK